MLKATSIPTPLISDDARPEVEIAPVPTPPRFPAVAATVRLLRWCATMLWLRLGRRGTPAEYGRRFRLLLEDFGGLWIKLGQLLSLRVDLFPLEFCRELSQLQIKAIGFPPAEAIRILQEDLGAPVGEFFREFQERPAAAASIGQVHVARLRESGVRVAIKVQRPQLRRTFEHQLRVMGWIVRLLQVVRFRPHMRWDDLIWELNHIMLEEMDCRYEASSTRRMRQTLKAHRIYVPKVYYSGPRVLVTEFVDGVLMADYIHTLGTDPQRVKTWLVENRIDPEVVGRRLALSLLRQVIEDNLYHGDLHPGNIMLLRDNRVALIDLGSCSFTEREFLERFRMSFDALARGDYAQTADLSFLLSGTMPPDIDPDVIRKKFLQAIVRWAARTRVTGLPYHEKSVTVIYNAIIQILFEHRCTTEWTLLRIRRALETLDSSLVHLLPTANYTKISAQYFRQADRRAFEHHRVRDLPAAALGGVDAALMIVDRLEEYALFQAEIVRRHTRVFQATTNKGVDLATTVVGRLAMLSVLGTILVAIACVLQWQPQWLMFVASEKIADLVRVLPPLDWQVWTFTLGAFAYGSAMLMRLRGRLRRQDPRSSERVAPV